MLICLVARLVPLVTGYLVIFHHHFLLSFLKRISRQQFGSRVDFIQVLTGDRRLVDHLATACLQSWNQAEWVLFQVPFRFILQIDVDGLMPDKTNTKIIFTVCFPIIFTNLPIWFESWSYCDNLYHDYWLYCDLRFNITIIAMFNFNHLNPIWSHRAL